MEEKQCKLCSTPTDSSSSRPFDGSRICSRCRWRIEPKCAVKGCSTLQKKQSIFKHFPTRVSELAPAAKLHLNLKYGLTAQTNKCCASCYLKLHRASAQISAMFKNKDSSCQGTPQSRECFAHSRQSLGNSSTKVILNVLHIQDIGNP